MINILFFLPSLTGGGAERTLVNLANGLDRLRYHVHFLVIDRPNTGKYKDEYSHFLKKDIVVHNLNIKINRINYIHILFRMISVIKSVKPDVVMSTMLRPNMMITLALIIGRYKGKIVLRESNNRSATPLNVFERKAIKYMYGRFADVTVSLSQGVKNDLCEHFDVDSNKVQVIYNPIDIIGIHALAKEELALEGNNILVAAGRLHKQKNYPLMIKALSLLNGDVDFHLYILGKGSLEEEIQKLICQEGLSEKVTLLGFQSNPYKYFARSKLFLLTSDWEGFGHVIVEAMACGLPVISTDCPYGPGEIIDNQKNGILVPVGDYKQFSEAIKVLLTDDSLRNELEANGRDRANDFDSRKITNQYEQLFESLLLN